MALVIYFVLFLALTGHSSKHLDLLVFVSSFMGWVLMITFPYWFSCFWFCDKAWDFRKDFVQGIFSISVLFYLVVLKKKMGFLFQFLIFFPIGALYCVCKDGVGDQALQKAIDYACGAGADCTPILQNGACFQPNTVKDHCNYAVNSYFQRKGQAQGSCDFSGAATPSQTPPSKHILHFLATFKFFDIFVKI